MNCADWTGTARYDRTRRYRYELTRRWGPGDSTVCWIMLNPSTASAEADDPTVRRCRHLAAAWGYDRMFVVNLFALRSTDPAALRVARDPVGPANDRAIVRCADRSDLVVAAWGRHGRLDDRDAHVLAILEDRSLWALDVNADATPRHPLYTPRTIRPRPYETPEVLA